jgi:succinate-semialdehyde dehydrogenase / glutarate-semialdehyde dehydrogenase
MSNTSASHHSACGDDYPAPAMLIDGEWITAAQRRSDMVTNPATGDVLGKLPLADPDDVQRALDAAARAGREWAEETAYNRAKLIRRAADLLRERCEQISVALTLENGKTLAESRAEIQTAADIFDWNADEGRRAYGRIVPARFPGQIYSVTKEPIGVVAAFAPWNFPAATAARKIAASLAAGCTCIIKPAEETPATAIALARALVDAGLAPGVLNVLFGVPAQISEQLLASPIVRKVTFTGSTPVGLHLSKLAAADGKRATMELGGHAPVIICDDADLAAAVSLGAAAKFRNAGQICVSPTRFFVQRGVYAAFVDRFAAAARALRVGSGLAEGTQMGPLANERRIAAMESLIGDCVQRGAKLCTGGSRIGNRGFFWEPTVLSDVPDDARIMNEEPFGPVAVINPFDDVADALVAANRLRFGLSAYAFTASAARARQISQGLKAGVVGLNTFAVTLTEIPFGGIDLSGDGREGGIEGLDSYMATKVIAHAM